MRAVDKSKCIGFVTDLFLILLFCMEVNSQAAANEVSNQRVAKKTCLLKPLEGPCRSNIPMYYFDPEVGDCERFLWGGCQGNGNRFDTMQSCLDECVTNSTKIGRPRWCFLNFDYGYCFGAVKRYYYDRLWQVCKERIYSGCGGNRNNFYSFEQCDQVCRFGNAPLKTTRKDKNKIHKVLIVNPREKEAKTKKYAAVQNLTEKGDFT